MCAVGNKEMTNKSQKLTAIYLPGLQNMSAIGEYKQNKGFFSSAD